MHDTYAAVYGELYESALTKMQLLTQAILAKPVVHASWKDAEEFAHENLLDKIIYVKSRNTFYSLTHRGEIVVPKSFKNYYGMLLRYKDIEGNVKMWSPTGAEYHDRAGINGEQTDGVRSPMYHRDYFTPTGFFDPVRDTFNVARPFPVFAKETGRDTSHIYTYIEHVAGECAPWVLSWLRTKMMYPTQKTQVVPIFVSRVQGTGKSTFADVICKGLFGDTNVLVTDQYDSQSRFNSDYADALIVSLEEKEEIDKRNSAATLKSRSTATTIRKEHKGIDPIYQESYTEFIVTTNNDVPIKFEGREDQRRFMVMETDPLFAREPQQGMPRTPTHDLADEVFTKLYGYDAMNNKVGVPFVEDKQLIAQFQHELYINEDIAAVKLRNFPKTAAYDRCFTLPRTTEGTEIESILRSLVPFIRESLKEKKLITQVTVNDEILNLANFVQTTYALEYWPAVGGTPAQVVICRPIVFYDTSTAKPFAHATVERALVAATSWFEREYGLSILPNMLPLTTGFRSIQGRNKMAPALRIADKIQAIIAPKINVPAPKPIGADRVGKRLRINNMWQPAKDGEFETVNEMRLGTKTLANKNDNVQYMDTFLFEADETSKVNYILEQKRLENIKEIQATVLYAERLAVQEAEAKRLFYKGDVVRVVYSGAKSYHMLLRAQRSPSTLEEYKWLHAYLCTQLSSKLKFDIATNDPARLTRTPEQRERITYVNNVIVKGTQELVFERWSNTWEHNWHAVYEAWLKRPLAKHEQLKGKRLPPTNPIYTDSMLALLEGRFWTDKKYDGQRQQLFFPAYRLCRDLGFSHDELWGSQGILDGLNMYYHKEEITYWESRESCSLIKEIDDDYS